MDLSDIAARKLHQRYFLLRPSLSSEIHEERHGDRDGHAPEADQGVGDGSGEPSRDEGEQGRYYVREPARSTRSITIWVTLPVITVLGG